MKHSSHIMKFYFAHLSGPLHRRMLKVNVDGFKIEPRTQSHTLPSQRDHCAEGDHTFIKIIVGKKTLIFLFIDPNRIYLISSTVHWSPVKRVRKPVCGTLMHSAWRGWMCERNIHINFFFFHDRRPVEIMANTNHPVVLPQAFLGKMLRQICIACIRVFFLT